MNICAPGMKIDFFFLNVMFEPEYFSCRLFYNSSWKGILIRKDWTTDWQNEWHRVSDRTAGTYEDAERRRAGREGCQKLQKAEARVSHIQVVVCSALFTAELLQSPPLHTSPRMLHQRSEKCLTEAKKLKVESLGAVLQLHQLQFPWLTFSLTGKQRWDVKCVFWHCSRTDYKAALHTCHVDYISLYKSSLICKRKLQWETLTLLYGI